jgi:transcriptional regulator with XRE-family HTH domain
MESLGAFLKAGRAEAGLTIEELADRTRIRRENLEALEREDLESLPFDPYVRGFVRLVCQELGLPGREGLVRYELLKERKAPPDEVVWSEERTAREPGVLERALRDPERVVRLARRWSRGLAWGLGGGLAIVLLVLAVRQVPLGGGDREALVAADGPPGEPFPGAERPSDSDPIASTVEDPPVRDVPVPEVRVTETAASSETPVPKEARAEPPAEEPVATEPPATEPPAPAAIESEPPATEPQTPGAPREETPIEDAPPPPDSRIQAVVESPDAVDRAAVAGETSIAPPSPSGVGTRRVLEVWARRDVEVSVLLDGVGHPRRRTLDSGQAKLWKADRFFLLSATDGGAVRVVLDGEDLGPAGPDGVPVDRKRIGSGGP